MVLLVMVTDIYTSSLIQAALMSSNKTMNLVSDSITQRVVDMNQSGFHNTSQVDNNASLFQLMLRDDSMDGLLSHPLNDGSNSRIFDEQITSQDDIVGEWLQLLTAGPLLANHVNSLLVHVSKRDFPLTHPTNFVFQYIKDQNSYRATVTQVSDSVYSTLLSVHAAMSRIQSNAQQLSNHVKTAFKLLAFNSPKLIDLMLPKTLEAIVRIANEVVAHSRTTFDKLPYVSQLLMEVMEMSTVIRSIYMSNVSRKRSLIVEKMFHTFTRTALPVATASIVTVGCASKLCYKDQASPNATAILPETMKQKTQPKAEQLQVVEETGKYDIEHITPSHKRTMFEKKFTTRDLDGMNKQEILNILFDSVLQMDRIKYQWSILIRFFDGLAAQAYRLQQIVVHEFISVIKDAQAQNQLTKPGDRELFVEILSLSCQKIEEHADLLYIMSKTYLDISSEYIIEQLSSKNTLLLLFQTDTERSSYLNTLSLNSTSASARVLQLTQERSQEYILLVKNHREEYDRLLVQLAEENLAASIG